HSIGQGAFGKVRIIQNKQTKQQYALKYTRKSKCVERNGLSNILREHDILELLVDHPYIPSLRYAFQDSMTLYMVMDLKTGGDLRSLSGFPETTVRLWVAEISCALHYLHTAHGIIHRDVKPENIFIDSEGHVSLGDFNAATWIGTGEKEEKKLLRGIIGTTSYMAPELLLRQGYSFSVDWWSLGVVMFECIYGRRPFRKRDHGGSREMLKMAILKENISVSDNHAVSVDCIAVIRGLLCSDPERRLGCGIDGHERLRRHPFFASIDWRLAEKKALQPEFAPGNCLLVDHRHNQLNGGVAEEPGDSNSVDGSADTIAAAAADNDEDLGAKMEGGSKDGLAELRALERGFTGYSYAEFAKYRDYILMHGRITAADLLDVYLAQIHLDGRPLATMDSDDTIAADDVDNIAADENDDEPVLKRKKSHLFASVAAGAAGLAHRARALGGRQTGEKESVLDKAKAGLKRRTTTSDAHSRQDKRRHLRGSWRPSRTRKQQAVAAQAKDNDKNDDPDASMDGLICGELFCDADVYSQSDSLPPANVPIDLVIWAQMQPGQRRLAHRFSCKMDVDAEYESRIKQSIAQSESNGPAKQSTREMRALTGDLPLTHTLASPSSSPLLQNKQNQQKTARQRPSFLHSVRHQPSASTLMDFGNAAGSGCSSPTTLLQTSGCPISPVTAVPRLQPIASGWTKQQQQQQVVVRSKKEPAVSVSISDEARDMPIHQRLENQLIL
ncbi:hypothetical protein J3B02_003873, partial [Coemansia erecta]